MCQWWNNCYAMLCTLAYCITSVVPSAALKNWLFSTIVHWLPKVRAKTWVNNSETQGVRCQLYQVQPQNVKGSFRSYWPTAKCLFLPAGPEKRIALFPPFPPCNACTWICSRAAPVWPHLHVPLLPHITHEVRDPDHEGSADLTFL